MDFLEPLMNLERPRMEERSTEEVLNQLQDAEQNIRELGLTDNMVGSLDVIALYPSLDQDGTAEEVFKMIERSQVEMSGNDWHAAQVFLSSNLSLTEIKSEGLKGLVPSCLKAWGPRPGHTTTELGAKRKDPEDPQVAIGEDIQGSGGGCPSSGPRGSPLPKGNKPCNQGVPNKWAETDVSQLSVRDKKKILGKVMKYAIKNIFRHHMYQFGGRSYCQAAGGPIGLRLTSIMARVVMDSWARGILVKLVQAKVDVHAFVKYVVDINLMMSMLEPGTRWTGSSLETREEWAQEDARMGRSREAMSMECTRMMADSQSCVARHPSMGETVQ